MANGSTAKAPAANSSGEGFIARIWRSIWETRFGRFLKECKVETLEKASWPTRRELQTFTIVVLFALLVVGFFIGALDSILRTITELLPS